MSFKKNKYLVVRNAISKQLADFIFGSFKIKRDAMRWYRFHGLISKQNQWFGTWEDKQLPNTFACYADWNMECLLIQLLPLMEEKLNLKLVPTYSYARLYKKGDVLKKHKDRASCEISTSLHLGGSEWDFYLDDLPIRLKQGDMLIYKGHELLHWREEFKGNICGQVFLHYNDLNGKFKNENFYDTRQILGIPPDKETLIKQRSIAYK